ncbi:MAG: cyclic nucleotide-binding domain-containing protein [Candidatus Gracilibacteria bacterium]|nr:cyclic nucleotide-binding domain-containing protein [Candidatus Gracilibacteria bacterium]
MPESIFALKIFQGIEKDIIQSIIDSCDIRHYEEGEMIIIEGEMSNGEGYIIKSGNVSIRIGNSRIAELSAGDIFGEIALLNEEERTASVSAETHIEVLVLTLNDLIKMINADDKVNKTVMKRIEENINRA